MGNRPRRPVLTTGRTVTQGGVTTTDRVARRATPGVRAGRLAPMTASTPGGTDRYELAAADADRLRSRLGDHETAVVLGSGWAAVARELGEVRDSIPMSDLDGCPTPTVLGHGGSFSSVDVAGRSVLVVAGRSHLYEGHAVDTVVHAVRAAVLSGCSTVVLTNAAGSLRPEVGVGRLVAITDQINLTGSNPMEGSDPPPPHPGRFVDLTELYSRRLLEAARAHDPDVAEGTYAGVLGGSFETPAEIRMLQVVGADVVGMSTVLEAIAAKHLGAEVFGVSLVTNLAAGLQVDLDHLDVLAAAKDALPTLVGLLRAVVAAG